MKVPHDVLAPIDWSDADADPTCWKYHIPPTVRENWKSMGTEARTTAAYMAQRCADREQSKSIVTKAVPSRGGWSE